VNVIPIVHRNVISFFGMKPRQEYLAFKETDDALIALDRTGWLTKWSKLNGRIEHGAYFTSENLAVSDLRGYEVF
jgi:hypothetical protein